MWDEIKIPVNIKSIEVPILDKKTSYVFLKNSFIFIKNLYNRFQVEAIPLELLQIPFGEFYYVITIY